MNYGVPRQINILGKAAPQVRRLFRRSVSVPDRFRVISPIRVFAMTILAHVAPLAFAAHHIVLNEDEIPLFETFAARELTACARDDSDVFVAHDHGRLCRGLLIKLHVGPADAGNLHLQ